MIAGCVSHLQRGEALVAGTVRVLVLVLGLALARVLGLALESFRVLVLVLALVPQEQRVLCLG